MSESREYVVTFERGRTLSLDGLRRMTLEDARSLLELAARIPRHGRIVRVTDCLEVS